MGKVQSGLLLMSRYTMTGSERISLPCPFSWPIRTCNLKRCLMVNRIPVADSDKELVVIDLHLEAYDSGEGKIAQTKALLGVLEEERAKGNYVIAGGDFNQCFSNTDRSAYPVFTGMWQPGEIDAGDFGGDFSLLMHPSVPTCRSLDRPLTGADPEGFQFYMIDGFVVSANVRADSVETLDRGFVCTDHSPVRMTFTLMKE